MTPLFAPSISNVPVVYFNQGFYHFGGATGSEASDFTDIIARFDGLRYTWSKVGILQQARKGSNAIHVSNGQFLVVGGSRGHPHGEGFPSFTEKCELQNDQMRCQSQQPELDGYTVYPELQLVPSNYCQHIQNKDWMIFDKL